MEGASILWDKRRTVEDSYPVLEFTESGDDPQSKVLKGPVFPGENLKPRWNWTCDFYIEDDSSGQGLHGDTVRILVHHGSAESLGATKSFTLAELVRPEQYNLSLFNAHGLAVGNVSLRVTQTEIHHAQTTNFKPGTLHVRVIGARLISHRVSDDTSTYAIIEMHNSP